MTDEQSFMNKYVMTDKFTFVLLEITHNRHHFKNMSDKSNRI